MSGPKVKLFERFKSKWCKKYRNTEKVAFIFSPHILASFDTTKYKPGTDDLEIVKQLGNNVKSLKLFIQNTMESEVKKGIVRKDYYEILEPSLLFLGEKIIHKTKKELLNPSQPGAATTSKQRVLFHHPGADHHARWMSKAVYSLKIYLFREQFHLTAREKKGLADFNVFVVRFYLKAWFQCPLSVSAAMLDLKFVKDMIDFIDEDKKLATAIITKFSSHLWYLSEEVIGMAFFDKNISLVEKRKMVANLQIGEDESSNSERSSEEEFEIWPEAKIDAGVKSKLESVNKFDTDFSMMNTDSDEESECSENFGSECSAEESSRNSDEVFESCERRVKVTPDEIIKSFKEKNISDFVTKKTFQFFRRFQISTNFLLNDPTTWDSDEHYIAGRTFVKKLRVTNDTAEQGVKLLIDFLGLLSKDEVETEYILQVVSEGRKEFPSHNIKDLVP